MFSFFRRFPSLRRLLIVVSSLPLMFAGGSLIGGLDSVIGGVGSLEISRGEFFNTYQRLEEYYRQNYDLEEIPDDLSQQILSETQNRLLSEYLMRASADDKKLYAPDEAVAEEIRQMEDFQDEDGNFSLALLNDYVSDVRRLQNQVRISLNRRPLLRAMDPFSVIPIEEELAAFRRQNRIVEEATLKLTTAFNIDEQNIARYYNANRDEYQIQEEADFEYVLISLDDFAAEYVPDDEDVELAYEEFVEKQNADEQRTASHIYISGTDEEASQRATEVATEAKQSPDNFAALAAKYSDDTGSAINGGDLGVVVRGDLPEAMETVLFTLSANEVSAPVVLDDGFSILKMGSSSATVPPLEVVREDVEKIARRFAAENDFLNEIDRLQDISYLNVGSLLSVAVAARSSVQTVTTIARGVKSNPSPFTDENLLDQIFVEEVLTSGEASPAVAVNDNLYLIARVLRYQEGRVKSLAEVGDEILGILRARQKITMIQADKESRGEYDLPAELLWRGPYTLSLTDETTDAEKTSKDASDEGTKSATGGGGDSNNDGTGKTEDSTSHEAGEEVLKIAEEIDDDAVNQIFIADLSGGMPSYAFVAAANYVRIFRINNVIENEPQEEDFEVVDQLLNPPQAGVGGAAYLESLSGRYDVFFDVPELQRQ
ncbi:peptidylprolyl isomerase [Candidatus Persebacteraceae bacterium Df01]|jgi:peptidyl-prolyl cis-trans isomerase D|uniref:Periplasmic chaperone PpiD n=1 Tax=Candidatus Doriopsillibacter californiensis TaxID=2970740 RepID=A0ABT7QMC5_9GAMM|nr:peptidylprolyl isomerase [Candidatus Persebacteraceae bacterium Df01]